MSITIFGYVLLLILLYGIIKNKKTKDLYIYYLTVTLIVTLNIHMGHFVHVGNQFFLYEQVFTYDEFLIFGMMIFSVILLFLNRKMNRKMVFLLCAVALIMVMNYMMFIIHPYDKQIIVGDWEGYLRGENVYSYLKASSIKTGYYLVILSNFLIMMEVKQLFTADDLKNILNNTIKFSKISILIGYVEFVTKNIFKTKIVTEVCCALIGVEGVQQNSLTNRNGLIMLQGATKEASMYTTVLFFIVVLLMMHSKIDEKYRKTNSRWIVATVVLLLVNPAMSAYIYLFLLVVIFLTSGLIQKRVLAKKLMRKNRILIVCGIILFCVAGNVLSNNFTVLVNSDNYFLQRIGRAVEQYLVIITGVGKLINSSEAQRLSGIVYDFQKWTERPLLGFGPGVIYCVSGFVTFLADFGLLGVAVYYYMIVKLSKNKKISYGQLLLFSAELWILPNLFLNDLKTALLLIIPIGCMIYGNIFQENVFCGSETIKEG